MEALQKRGQYRFVPPVETFVPLSDPAPKRPDAFLVEGKRLDGRSADEFRPVCMPPLAILLLSVVFDRLCAAAVLKTGVISQAAGSAYIEMNQTKVICGVYVPSPSHVLSDEASSLAARADGEWWRPAR
jgi:hypothetical protein